MAQIHNLGTGEILGVRLMHQVTFSSQVECELLVSHPVHGSNVLKQCDDVHPFEIVCRRMAEQGFERPEACAV